MGSSPNWVWDFRLPLKGSNRVSLKGSDRVPLKGAIRVLGKGFRV